MAGRLAVEAAMAKRMFAAPKLYRWVLKNLRTLPEDGNVRQFYLAQARSVCAEPRQYPTTYSTAHTCTGIQRKRSRV